MREGPDNAAPRDGTGQLEGQSSPGSAAAWKKGDRQLEGLDAAPAAAAKAEVMESTSDPEYSLAVEVHYHGMRQSFLVAMHRWTMALTIVFGASAAATFYGDKLCGLLAAAVAAADIAFDFVGRSQAHADIKRRYFEMVGDLSRGELKDFGARWMVISADEPPLLRYVSILAEREACEALGREIPERLHISGWHSLTAHLRRG